MRCPNSQQIPDFAFDTTSLSHIPGNQSALWKTYNIYLFRLESGILSQIFAGLLRLSGQRTKPRIHLSIPHLNTLSVLPSNLLYRFHESVVASTVIVEAVKDNIWHTLILVVGSELEPIMVLWLRWFW